MSSWYENSRGQETNYEFESGSNRDDEMKERISFITFIVSAVFVIIVTVCLIFGSVYLTTDTQNAVVTTFGNPGLIQTSGIHFKLPCIQKVIKVDMTSRGMAIGYTVEGDETIADEAVMITKDFNFLEVFFYLEYQVSDAMKFLYNSEDPEVVLSNLAQSAIRDTVGSYGVDQVLTTSRPEIEDKVKEVLINSVNAADIGIKINDVTIQDVDTPTAEVKAAFDKVESAKQDADRLANEARTYNEQQIPKAEAEADKLRQDANAQKTARINEANGQVSRFNSLYEEYKNAPEVTKLRMYYEVMEEVMPKVKVVITNEDGNIVNVFNQPTAETSEKK